MDKEDRLVDGLAGPGWAIVPDFFTRDLMRSLREDLAAMQVQSGLRPAGTGRGGDGTQNGQVRTDSTLWLDGSTDAQRAYLGRMEDLRLTLNRALMAGLFDYECHYALYAAGGFYRRHVDSLQGARNRIISCVTYLTPDWVDGDAGHLVLYDPQTAAEIARTLPLEATLAVFMSETIPHEVLPPARERASIAGWFRCNPSSGARVDPDR